MPRDKEEWESDPLWDDDLETDLLPRAGQFLPTEPDVDGMPFDLDADDDGLCNCEHCRNERGDY